MYCEDESTTCITPKVESEASRLNTTTYIIQVLTYLYDTVYIMIYITYIYRHLQYLIREYGSTPYVGMTRSFCFPHTLV